MDKLCWCKIFRREAQLRYSIGAIVFVFIFLVVLPRMACPIPADVTDISDGKYFGVILSEIDKAKESIFIAMYRIEVNPEVKDSMPYMLIAALEEAVKRGVKVVVYLEFDYNFSAFNMLNRMGAEVYLSRMAGKLHDKLIVVDKELVFTGSHNWSFSAFKRNSEDGNLIRSKEYAEIKIQNIRELPIVAPKVLARVFECVFINEEFLLNPDLFPKMVRRQEERTFDLYLLLLRYFREEKSPTFKLDVDKAAGDLGLDLDMDRSAYRRQIIKVLRKLKDRYKLIRIEFVYGKPAEVTLLDWQDKGKLYKNPIDNYLEIPLLYWDYAWAKKLSFRAKFAYLVCLRERKTGSFYPWWSRSLENLAKRYSLNRTTIQDGLRELKKLNLLEVKYSPGAETGFQRRMPNRYFLNSLYSDEELEQKWSELKNLYGKKDFDTARQLATVVEEGYDPIVIEGFLLLIKEHGEELVREATDMVAKKALDNPARNYRYIKGILENWEGRKK